MPIYCHACACGARFEDARPMAQASAVVKCPNCGKAAPRDYRGERKGGHHAENWPQWSMAAGCPPHQLDEQRAADKRNGLHGYEYNAEGEVRFDSPGHKERYLKAHGMYDKKKYG